MWRLGLPATVTLTLTVLVANYALWIYVYKNRGKLMTVSQLFQDEELGEKFGGEAEAPTTSKTGVAEIEYEGCPDRCYIANDRHMLSFSDAIVFYGRDIDPEHMPEERAPFQKWIYWSLEPPWHTPVALLKDLNNTINWTMTYRHDSDVRNDYATIRKVMPTQQPYSEQTLKEIWKGKSKTAVWAASSCKTSGKREHYVEELQKHLYVDVYGECGENACPRGMAQTCYQMFARNYFFYLSLENCICKDYVTEKLYTPLLYDIIPVVYGGANYSNVAPSGSYIDALSFESPMYLARYLKKVAKNYKLYRSYFQWKGKYDIEPSNGYNFCNLCRKLHSDDFKKTSVVPDIYNWWNTTSNCRVWNRRTKKVE
ncbi:hypothetical protein HPB51_024762 [Rhipicephalus microplus]|uniref:Fucosyltransferase n=1 Tax=Rhipicephalus microplus TaxID=6941 RepID=A0A9J6D8H0_RHIMP|nr:hypothetical protein HPB51_024762 [Rhipicephalus microplus]